jgi:hypothetical protein
MHQISSEFCGPPRRSSRPIYSERLNNDRSWSQSKPELLEEAQLPDATGLTIGRLATSFESLGRVLDLLSEVEPFASYELKPATRAIREQLAQGTHVAASDDSHELVGYAGWVHTSRSSAELWIEDKGRLTPVPPPTDAVALTIVVSRTPAATTKLIRAARELNPALRVYFKRGYEGTLRMPKKKTVLNSIS